MCTSIAMETDHFYFGRNMDIEYEFGARVVVTPRNYPFQFRRAGEMKTHYAMIGMATVISGYPLYAEAVNEKGLCIAGLNFPGNAYYSTVLDSSKANISPFELTPWLLGRCANLAEARKLLETTSLVSIPFSEKVPLSPLHWHIADKTGSLVLEATSTGMHLYENPMGILTNNPPFDFHVQNVCQYMNLTPRQPDNCFHTRASLKPFSLGMGSIGLPGDFSSASRFVKASYLLLNSAMKPDDENGLAQFFHLLASVSMVRGAVIVPDGRFEITTYSCCTDVDRGIYYYTTYTNQQITSVELHRENLDSATLIEYPLRTAQQIFQERQPCKRNAG